MCIIAYGHLEKGWIYGWHCLYSDEKACKIEEFTGYYRDEWE